VERTSIQDIGPFLNRFENGIWVRRCIEAITGDAAWDGIYAEEDSLIFVRQKPLKPINPSRNQNQERW